MTALGVLAASSFTAAVVLCVIVRDVARRRRLVDVPNERSLHTVPVPRLGGVALTLAVWSVLAIGAQFAPILRERDLLAWIAGSFLIAVVGFLDDVVSLSARVRLLVQVVVASGVLAIAPLATDLSIAGPWHVSVPRVALFPTSVVFVVGATNIYNFMDGMDGIAGTQAAGAGVALGCAAVSLGQYDVAAVALAIAAASAGFLVHNMPPATLFLGDAGSTFLGFSFSTLGLLAATRPTPVPCGVVIVALAPFLLDGSFTIVRRLSRGERIWQAHKSHLYQRAVGTGLTHRDVLFVYAPWVALACAGGLVTANADRTRVAAVTLSLVVSLLCVWGWVARRERRVVRGS